MIDTIQRWRNAGDTISCNALEQEFHFYHESDKGETAPCLSILPLGFGGYHRLRFFFFRHDQHYFLFIS